MNQRTLAKAAVPTSSPLTAPDRVGALLAATMYRPWSVDPTGTNAEVMTNTSANGVSGVIVAITSSSITLRRRGFESTFAITPKTAFTDGPIAITLSDLTYGEHVGIQLSPSSASTAAHINIQLAVLVGRVIIVNDNKIIIDNQEGVSRTIVVNALTTFEKLDAATSLSELSVGSLVRARGTVDATLTHLDASSVEIEHLGAPALPNAGFG